MLFDALVTRDGDAPGLEGRVCLCVDEAEEQTCWWAELGERVRTGFSASPPEADVTLRMSADAAEGLLVEGRMPPEEEREVIGDGALFERFIRRYTEKRSFVDVRAGDA